MDFVLRDLEFVYSDDVLVARASVEEHLLHPRQVFGRLEEHGLIINPAKCQFSLAVIDFLGHRISSRGAVPLPSSPCNLPLFLRESKLYQQIKEKVRTDSIKQE